MAQSLSKVLVHLVFSTKERQPVIPKSPQSKLHAYLAGICRTIGSEPYRIGGTSDHVHIACTLPRTLAVSKLVEEAKKSSSKWIKKQEPPLKQFSWQTGYGVFSLGQSQLETLIEYIDNQAQHHRRRSFQEELLEFLNRYGVEYDEQYLWG